MAQNRPMLRMIQGDVGSGKTVVAFFGCMAAWKNKKQAAIMAPTEILAQQHFLNFQKLLQEPRAEHFQRYKVALIDQQHTCQRKKSDLSKA